MKLSFKIKIKSNTQEALKVNLRLTLGYLFEVPIYSFFLKSEHSFPIETMFKW